jgi:KaiC/GvpD/RAD55 family RecA-like ATPase
MKFSTLFSIAKGDVICVVGAGGKTSLVKKLAGECADSGYKVLISTTTRFASDQVAGLARSGADVLVEIEGEKAFSDADSIREKLADYDIVIIEADGAACKRLKGWKESEPVIPEFTTKTIGVVDSSVTGEKLSEEIVHRIDIFRKIADAKDDTVISKRHIINMIKHPKGLFQYAVGEKIVYFSKISSENVIIDIKDISCSLEYKCIVGDINRDFAEIIRC